MHLKRERAHSTIQLIWSVGVLAAPGLDPAVLIGGRGYLWHHPHSIFFTDVGIYFLDKEGKDQSPSPPRGTVEGNCAPRNPRTQNPGVAWRNADSEIE